MEDVLIKTCSQTILTGIAKQLWNMKETSSDPYFLTSTKGMHPHICSLFKYLCLPQRLSISIGISVQLVEPPAV